MRPWTGLLLGAMAVGAGCYTDGYVYPSSYSGARPLTVAIPPPAPLVEQPPPEPFAGAVWMAGYWEWQPDLGRHVWIAGRWTAPPRAGVAYMPPSWRSYGRGLYYRVPGRWVVAPPRDAYGRHVAYDSLGRPYYF